MLILILPFKFWQVLKVQDLACTHAILVHRIFKVKVNGKDWDLIIQHWLKNSHLINKVKPEADGALISPPFSISSLLGGYISIYLKLQGIQKVKKSKEGFVVISINQT